MYTFSLMFKRTKPPTFQTIETMIERRENLPMWSWGGTVRWPSYSPPGVHDNTCRWAVERTRRRAK